MPQEQCSVWWLFLRIWLQNRHTQLCRVTLHSKIHAWTRRPGQGSYSWKFCVAVSASQVNMRSTWKMNNSTPIMHHVEMWSDGGGGGWGWASRYQAIIEGSGGRSNARRLHELPPPTPHHPPPPTTPHTPTPPPPPPPPPPTPHPPPPPQKKMNKIKKYTKSIIYSELVGPNFELEMGHPYCPSGLGVKYMLITQIVRKHQTILGFLLWSILILPKYLVYPIKRTKE